MSDYEHAVFISYAWGGESEQIANQIDLSLQTRGIRIVRDRRDLDYKGSIGEFMERIGRGDCVIAIISDKYLRSKNCMFELVEIADHKDFSDRIFPIILSDARIYDPVERLDYVEYWEKEKSKLNERIRNLTDLSHLQGIREELDNYDRFRDRISGLTSTLKDMNTLTPDMHRNSNFEDLYTKIEKRLKENEGFVEIQAFEPKTILIPGGPFLMGAPLGNNAPTYEGPQHEVKLPDYCIGKHPIKNSEYQEFINQTGKLVPRIMGWEGQNYPVGQDNSPVLGVTFFDAIQYCEWLSEVTNRPHTIPNEAQWEKACRGAYGVVQPMGQILEWTCSLWGEKRIEPDAKYAYPWKNDGRNDIKVNRPIRRIVRGYTGNDETGLRRLSARSGRSPDDTGSGDSRYGFRVLRVND